LRRRRDFHMLSFILLLTAMLLPVIITLAADARLRR
jgi:hypothetical protein